MKVTILTKEVEVVRFNSVGSLEPDYEAFYQELESKTVVVDLAGDKWNVSAHEDLSSPSGINISLKSVNPVRKGERYVVDFFLDKEGIEYSKNNPMYLDTIVWQHVKNIPITQRQFDKFLK